MKLLADSDFLIALARPKDSNHLKAKKLLEKIYKENLDVWISNLVKQESATVMSHKEGMRVVVDFINTIEKAYPNQLFLSERDELKAWKYFLSINKKGTSFVDCSNVVLLDEYKLDKIVSFDKFYKDLRFK